MDDSNIQTIRFRTKEDWIILTINKSPQGFFYNTKTIPINRSGASRTDNLYNTATEIFDEIVDRIGVDDIISIINLDGTGLIKEPEERKILGNDIEIKTT
jgi:hypothetical protein